MFEVMYLLYSVVCQNNLQYKYPDISGRAEVIIEKFFEDESKKKNKRS